MNIQARLRILLVDDHALTRYALRPMPDMNGLDVLRAATVLMVAASTDGATVRKAAQAHTRQRAQGS